MAPSEHFHTIEEWEAIRPIFTALYQEERKKLDDVRKILEHRYAFTTTVKQCKTKIREWNLGKYKKQRELLHAKRLFNEGRRRGRHVTIRLRGDPVTLDDIAKHFKRKATDLDDIDSMIPSSPTPPELTWTFHSRENSPNSHEPQPGFAVEVDIPDSNADFDGIDEVVSNPLALAVARSGHVNMTFTHPSDEAHCIHGSHLHVPRGLHIDNTERGFFSLRDLVEADFGNISVRNTYPDWWNHLDGIVVDFDNAQFHHMAGRQELALRSYDRVLEAVTQYAQLPSMALLQFVSYLLSWAAIPVSGDVVKVLFQFLDGLKNQKRTHPALATILPCLLSSPEHASCSIALFQECISNFLTQQLGNNSITVLRMNLRLCRHVFQMDDQEPAWATLRAISELRTTCREDTLGIIDPQLDQELFMTLQLFDESIRDKTQLEQHMRPCTNTFKPPHHDDSVDVPGHSLCNFKLGLYAIAYKQARATAKAFSAIYPATDARVLSANELLQRIDRIKADIKNAGVVWPFDADAHSQTDSFCESSPDGISHSLQRSFSWGMHSNTDHDSPQTMPDTDDYYDHLQPTYTNQSQNTNVTSYPAQMRHDSMNLGNSPYPDYISFGSSPSVGIQNRFQEID